MQVPRGRPFRIPTQHGPPPPIGAITHYNASYNHGHQQHVTNAPFYDAHNIPTAPHAQEPLPPPYDMNTAPPPYSANMKHVPPPPEYTTVIGQSNTLGYKPGHYTDGMPPPSH